MIICPKCKTFLEPNVSVCPECGEDLSDYELEEVEVGEPEVIYQARNLAEAQSIVEYFKDNGVPASVIENQFEFSSLTAFKPMSATDVIVGSNYLDKAQELLEEYLNAEPIMEDEWDDEDGNEEDELTIIDDGQQEEDQDKLY